MLKMSVDSLFEASKLLFDYVTKNRGYNIFIIDELESSDIIKLRKYIDAEDKIEAIKMYRKLSNEIDILRDRYCYNILSEKSSFRGIAKDLYRELKESWLLYSEEFDYIGYILRFISTSDYYVIKEFLNKKAYTMYYYKDIPLDPDSFYCGYVPLEAILDYCIKYYILYSKTLIPN